VEHPVPGVPVPLGRQQAGPAGSRHAAAQQEDVGFLAGLQYPQLGVDRGQLGALGDVRTPTIADLFVAMMSNSRSDK